MRINKYVAESSALSRRGADKAIAGGRVTINGIPASLGSTVEPGDTVLLDGRAITPRVKHTVVLFNKPRGCVVSRDGQGSKTIYDIIDATYRHLQPAGRLDKDSSGLLVLTDDGELAQQLTHPGHQKTKVYRITLDRQLEPLHQQMISDIGIELSDGRSQLLLERLDDGRKLWQVTMSEGRNRQIRRTFDALGYNVTSLHRTQFGAYHLGALAPGETRILQAD